MLNFINFIIYLGLKGVIIVDVNFGNNLSMVCVFIFRFGCNKKVLVLFFFINFYCEKVRFMFYFVCLYFFDLELELG